MIIVACVLKSGGSYGPEYVYRLAQGVHTGMKLPHEFVCLTDMRVPKLATVRLEEGWPGWWSKLELFRPGLFRGRVLYIDLDTAVVGSLDELAEFDGDFGMLADWNHEWLGASGVMAWDTESRARQDIWQSFNRNPSGVIGSRGGDQRYISRCTRWEDLRALYPGQIVSRWHECEQRVPPDARLVCFHGSPRPHEIGWQLTGPREAYR